MKKIENFLIDELPKSLLYIYSLLSYRIEDFSVMPSAFTTNVLISVSSIDGDANSISEITSLPMDLTE